MTQQKKGTISKKNDFRKIADHEPETGDKGKPVKTGTFDFTGGSIVQLGLGQTVTYVIGIISVTASLVWFIGTKWYYEVKMTNLKSEIKKEILDECNNRVDSLKKCLKAGSWIGCFE